MKDAQNAPPIAEAVSLLGSFAPGRLSELKRQLPPEIHPLLSPGGLAGPLPVTLKSRAAVQLAALTEVIRRISNGISIAERRLKLGKRIRLVGDIAAVLGSSSVLAGVAGRTGAQSSSGIIAISGIIALLGALAGLLSDYATRLPDGSGGSLFEVYSGLGETRFQAETLVGEIESLMAAEQSEEVEEPLTATVGAANLLCRNVQKSFAQIMRIAG